MTKLFNTFCLVGIMLLGMHCSGPSTDTEVSSASDSTASPGLPPDLIKMAGLDLERGVHLNSAESTPGYIIFSSLSADDVYMIDKEGNVVHTWEGDMGAGPEYLMEDGRLIRGARDPDAPRFSGGGMMGRILEYSWDGEILWDYKLANDKNLIHHDIAPMPNGNVLAIVYEHKTAEEVMAAGRTAQTTPKEGLWPDMIVEIEPVRPNGGRIVWEWHSWDHMVQEADPEKANYGVVAEHPELIHLNNVDSLPVSDMTPEKFQEAIMRGDMAMNANADNRGSDMFHTNAINYNAELDQIVISVPDYNEIWVIDHSTTTEEAAGHTGGKHGKGGDLIYRWGNPQMYHRGGEEDRWLGFQHDVRWIPEGYPGEGHLTMFNNNAKMTDSIPFSQVLEIAPPKDANGMYIMPEEGAAGPADPVWMYSDKGKFFAPFISSAHRMQNGNTLINSGPQGRLFEVSPEGEVVWDYWSPYIGDAKLPNGAPPQPTGPFKYAVFRATFVPMDHPALQGKELQPVDPQPATQKAM